MAVNAKEVWLRSKSLFGKGEGQTVCYALTMRKTFEPRES
jgi:hypothetical protein